MRRKVQVEPIVCHACGLQVLGRGGDLEGWKAVQMDPDVADLHWFCLKPVCQHAYGGALVEAQQIWARKMPQPPQEDVELALPPPGPSEPDDAQEAVQEQPEPEPEPKEPPPELLAFETSDMEEAGFRDEVFPYSRFAKTSPAEDAEPPSPPPAEGRYVPKPSAQSKAKFVHREGTGEPDE